VEGKLSRKPAKEYEEMRCQRDTKDYKTIGLYQAKPKRSSSAKEYLKNYKPNLYNKQIRAIINSREDSRKNRR
jgi:hypothetical protein